MSRFNPCEIRDNGQKQMAEQRDGLLLRAKYQGVEDARCKVPLLVGLKIGQPRPQPILVKPLPYATVNEALATFDVLVLKIRINVNRGGVGGTECIRTQVRSANPILPDLPRT
jgi:hypothetical protein